MIKNLIKITIILLCTLISKNALALENIKGLATEYVITITRVEICETGSTETNCLNPIDITIGSGGTADIGSAAISSGQAAAAVADFAKAPIGKTYTYIQTILSREMTITGTAGACKTKNGEVGTLGGNRGGAAVGHTNAATSTSLYVPHFTEDTDSLYLQGSNADGSSLSNNGVIAAGNTHFRSRQILTKPYTPTPGSSPTVFLAFDTANAVLELNDGNCADAGLQAAAPVVIITIQGQ